MRFNTASALPALLLLLPLTADAAAAINAKTALPGSVANQSQPVTVVMQYKGGGGSQPAKQQDKSGAMAYAHHKCKLAYSPWDEGKITGARIQNTRNGTVTYVSCRELLDSAP